MTSMRYPRWWQCGLLGGVSLSVTTLVRAIPDVICGALTEVGWTQVVGFLAAIFGMGFVCGLVAWAGRGLSRRFGLVGDAILGMAVMLVFFALCMLLFESALLGTKWSSGGLPMLGLGALAGLFGGAWIGHDLRKYWAGQENELC
jgi:hypothetical protein